jgi:DNA-directed RNA polymerase subunit RPC12/RpoP
VSLLDRAAAAGALTSRIDHQDAAAAFITLSLLAGETMFGIAAPQPEGVVIHCEGKDDLELISSETRCLVSVKAQSADIPLLFKEYRRLSANRTDQTRAEKYALVLIGPQSSQVVIFAEQLKQAQHLVASRERAEVDDIRHHFRQRWPKFDENVIDTFYIMFMYQGLYSREYTAVSAKLLRVIAPVADYTDERLMYLLSQINDRFAKARLVRGSVTLSEIRDIIFSVTMPFGLVTLANAYVRTAYGYVKHPSIEGALEHEERDYRNAVRFVMRRYRRATRKHRLLALTLGPVKCIACNGPLMANLWGWRRQGIACAHCGFTPFSSLFYACTCGRPVLLVRQPPLDLVDMAVSLRQAYAKARCEKCGQKPVPERLHTRTFGINVPWPPESIDSDLLEERKRFGWSKIQFRDGKANPMETLLAEALIDRIDHRIPGDSN